MGKTLDLFTAVETRIAALEARVAELEGKAAQKKAVKVLKGESK